MGSHIAWMLFALHVPYSEFCKDGLMMVSWPKHVVIKIKYNNILLCLTETGNYFVVNWFNLETEQAVSECITQQLLFIFFCLSQEKYVIYIALQ